MILSKIYIISNSNDLESLIAQHTISNEIKCEAKTYSSLKDLPDFSGSDDIVNQIIIDLTDFKGQLSAINREVDLIVLLGDNELQSSQHKPKELIPEGINYVLLNKPFSFYKLIEIVKQNSLTKSKNELVNCGCYTIDFARRQLKSEGDSQLVALTEKEANIIRYLYRAYPNSLKRHELLDKVWQASKDADTHTLETHIYRLRQKIVKGDKFIINDDKGYRLNY